MDNDTRDWFVIAGIGYSIYFVVYYLLVEVIGISLLAALLLFWVFPLYATYINNYYNFYVNEYDSDETTSDST